MRFLRGLWLWLRYALTSGKWPACVALMLVLPACVAGQVRDGTLEQQVAALAARVGELTLDVAVMKQSATAVGDDATAANGFLNIFSELGPGAVSIVLALVGLLGLMGVATFRFLRRDRELDAVNGRRIAPAQDIPTITGFRRKLDKPVIKRSAQC